MVDIDHEVEEKAQYIADTMEEVNQAVSEADDATQKVAQGTETSPQCGKDLQQGRGRSERGSKSP